MGKASRVKRLEQQAGSQFERVYVLAARDCERFYVGSQVYESKEELAEAFPDKRVVIVRSKHPRELLEAL